MPYIVKDGETLGYSLFLLYLILSLPFFFIGWLEFLKVVVKENILKRKEVQSILLNRMCVCLETI